MKTYHVLALLFSLACVQLAFGGINDGMVAYYPFDGNAQDASGNGNHGVEHGGVTYEEGISGQAAGFDGDTGYVRVPSSPSLDLPPDFTISAWILPLEGYGTPGGYYGPHIVGRWGSNGTDLASYFVALLPDGRPWIGTYESWVPHIETQLVGPDSIPILIWSHLVAMRSGSTLKIYVDNVLQASVVYAAAPQASDYDLHIGNQSVGGLFFGGRVDELRIYNRALSEQEVQVLFADTAVPQFTCIGFQPPMASGPVTVRGNRALPLKARLFDSDGFQATDLDLATPPVIQVMYQAAGGGDPVDVTGDGIPAGHGTNGNEFEYNVGAEIWQYNLKTKNYSAAGTYTITMVPGDHSEYIIDPTCEAVFERD